MENAQNSRRKKIRGQGFRSRMQTKGGRKALSRQRRVRTGAKKRK